MRSGVLFLLVLSLASAQDRQVSNPLSGPALIDKRISERWSAEGITPAAMSDDAEFLRRAYLDIVGVIPPADEVIRFLGDRRPDKRAILIDALLAHPAYAQHWSDLWEAILVGYNPRNPDGQTSLGRWLRENAFAKNLPFDEMTRRIIAAKGRNRDNMATVYWTGQLQRGRALNDVASRTTQIFLGTQIHCAQCHDHPFDRYTQEDYVQTIAFFVRLQQRKVKPQDQTDQEFEILEGGRNEAQFPPDPQARNRRAMPPRYFDGSVPEANEARRDAFVRIITRPDNLQFAVALVNRYWGHFFGRGVVHPLDDFNLKNKPSHPELLTELAQDFIAHKFDLKWLIRAITLSRTYQLSSRKPAKAGAEKLFGYALVRTMTPEQLFASMIEAIGVEDQYKAMERRAEGRDQATNERTNYIRQFRFTFGDDEQADVLEFDGTIPQALVMLNGDLLNRRMQQPNSRLDLILRTRPSAGERLELIFLSAMSRRPTPKEAARCAAYVSQKGNKRETYEDIMWSLLNSSEFFFIH